MHRRIGLFLLLTLLVTPLFAQTKSDDILPFKASEKTLPNGLKVIVVPTGFPNLVSIQIPVLTGSRNEIEPGKSGFAHFFEHMMFRGTKKYPKDKYQEIISKTGANQNAFTTDDFTNYYLTFAKEDLETVLELEADRFQNLDYTLEDFKTEARAVLGEYNKNSASPINKLDEVQRESAFTTHTYKHTTMGFLKDIEDMPNQFEYSKVFFDRWYRPENTVIIVAGDVEPARVFQLVEKYWGSWKPGNYKAAIPAEPPANGPVYAHVPWQTPTIPWVAVAFHGPAFSESEKDFAAMDLLFDLYFGETSDLYKKLVEQEQKVDQIFTDNPGSADPSLVTIYARVKDPKDAVYVRDEIMRTYVRSMNELMPADRVESAKSNLRYSLLRSLDNTGSIAARLARYVRYRRSYDSINNVYRIFSTLQPEDLRAVARKYFTDKNLVVTTMSHQLLVEGIKTQPALASFAPASAATTGSDIKIITQKTPLTQLNTKIQIRIGSAHDPKGKEGLAALSAAMIADAGSKSMRIDEINKAFYPMAGLFRSLTDKEVTTFTASIHRDNWEKFFDIALAQLLDPGFREEDFSRLKDEQLNALTQDFRANNDEEFGKERLQANIFRGSAYEHPVLGTEAGIKSITIDDVRNFVRQHYTRGNLTVGVNGDAPEEMLTRLRSALSRLPDGTTPAPVVTARMPQGVEVDIVQKDTRGTAISFGFPIEVTRSHPDFAALSVARAWLGEHRSSMSHLYQRIRETRGMNYGDYAYIEAFPRGMFMMTPGPNTPRRKQIFEVWIRPVVPENAHMALRIATHELEKLVSKGLSQSEFEKTRDYLMKNVYVITATQDQQLGYALDSSFYGIGDYASYMRERLSKLKVADVNRAVRKHLNAKNLSIVVITKDAEGLKQALVSDVFSPIKYDADKPADLLAEDKVIGARKLGIKAAKVTVTPVGEVFAK